MKILSTLGWCAGVLLLSAFLTDTGSSQSNATQYIHPSQVGTGEEWLAWNPKERESYIDGYLAAYFRGSHDACKMADLLFENNVAHHPGDDEHPSDTPSARCLARMDTFTKAKWTEKTGKNYGVYIDVLTEFYRKHPEYRSIPFLYLMTFLSDQKYRTADQLYQMALEGKLRTVFY